MWIYKIGMVICLGVALVSHADETTDQFNFATGLLIKDEPELAADEFRKLLQAHPEFAQADLAWFRLGEALQQAKNPQGAREAFARVVTDYPQSERVPRANYLLAGLLLGEDAKRAAAAYAAAAAGDPQGALAEPALFGQAEALYRADEWTAASAAYATLVQRFSDGKYVAQALNGQGWAAFKTEDYTAAERFFTVFLDRFADHALADECRLKRGDSRYRLKRYDDARADYEAVAAQTASPHRPAALAGRAWCLYDAGHPDTAAPAFRAAAAAFDDDRQVAALRFNAGNAAFAAGQFAAAEDDFAACAKTAAPELARSARYWQAAAFVRLERHEEACALLTKLRADGGLPADLSVDAWMLQAEAELARNRPREAAACYAAVGRDHPGHARAGDAAAGEVLALEKAGDLAAAETAAAAFVAAYPQHSQIAAVTFLLGEYRYRRERFAEAIPAFEAFLKAYGDHALAVDAAYKAGWACWQLEKPAQAAAFFKRVVETFPKSTQAPEAAFMAGRCADALGDEAGAMQAFARAVALAPQSDAGLRAELERIRLDHRAKRYAEALARGEAFVQAFGDVPAAVGRLPFAWLYIGEARLELGQPQEALEAYGRTTGGDAAVVRAAKAGRAWALRKLAKPAEAAALFDELAADDPTGESLFWAARSRDDAGDAVRAIIGYEAFLKHTAAGPLADEAAYRRAAARARVNGFAATEAMFAELVETRPASAFAAATLYDLAWSLLEQKKTAEALQRFDELTRRFPDQSLAGDAHFRVGEIAYNADAFERAVTAYEAALAAGVPFTDKVLYKLGWACERLAQSDAARAAFHRLATECPESELAGEARYREGRLLQEAGNWQEAAAVYATVPAGTFAERAAFGRAECLRLNKQAPEAVAAYRALLQNATDATIKMQAWLGLGHAYREAGAQQDAIEAYGEVVKLTETVEAAQAVLGQGYAWLAMGTFDEAAKAFLKVDILYGYDELKPEAVAMLVKTWEQAGDQEKAARYRQRLEKMKP